MNTPQVVGIVGPPGIGTSAAVVQASKIIPGARSLSFGKMICDYANGANLQDFGQKLFEKEGPAGMVGSLLKGVDTAGVSTLFIDGIRHSEIWEELERRFPGSRLVYTQAAPDLANWFLRATRKTSKEKAHKILSHRVEKQDEKQLRSHASKVLTLKDRKSTPNQIVSALVAEAGAAPAIVEASSRNSQMTPSGFQTDGLSYADVVNTLEGLGNISDELKRRVSKLDLKTSAGKKAYMKMVAGHGDY